MVNELVKVIPSTPGNNRLIENVYYALDDLYRVHIPRAFGLLETKYSPEHLYSEDPNLGISKFIHQIVEEEQQRARSGQVLLYPHMKDFYQAVVEVFLKDKTYREEKPLQVTMDLYELEWHSVSENPTKKLFPQDIIRLLLAFSCDQSDNPAFMIRCLTNPISEIMEEEYTYAFFRRMFSSG